MGVVCSKTTKSSKDFAVSNKNGTLSNKAEEDGVQHIISIPNMIKKWPRMVILMEGDETNMVRVSLIVTKEQ